jgi:hypothetical protein
VPYSPVRLQWAKVNQEELELTEILALLKLVSFDDRQAIDTILTLWEQKEKRA